MQIPSASLFTLMRGDAVVMPDRACYLDNGVKLTTFACVLKNKRIQSSYHQYQRPIICRKMSHMCAIKSTGRMPLQERANVVLTGTCGTHIRHD